MSHFRRYRAFRDETCGSFVNARPYRRASASGLSRCAGRLKTREVGEQKETFGINGIDEDSQGLARTKETCKVEQCEDL